MAAETVMGVLIILFVFLAGKQYILNFYFRIFHNEKKKIRNFAWPAVIRMVIRRGDALWIRWGWRKKGDFEKLKKGIYSMRRLKKGTNIGKIEKKGSSRIEIQCEMGHSRNAQRKNQCIEKMFIPKRAHSFKAKFQRGLQPPQPPRRRSCNSIFL